MHFQNAEMVCTQHYNRQLAALQILLIFEALIRRDLDAKPVLFRLLQKIAIERPRPTLLRRRVDLVLSKLAPKPIRDVLIEQDTQIAGFRRTV